MATKPNRKAGHLRSNGPIVLHSRARRDQLIPPMSKRRADVFFYGLFMDQELLQAKGLQPEHAERGVVKGLALRIGQRAALVVASEAQVHGVVVSVRLDELDRLYSDPSVLAYRPEAVLVQLESGDTIAALCYNLPEPPSPSERNPEYAAKLRAVAGKVGLPAEYVASLH